MAQQTMSGPAGGLGEDDEPTGLEEDTVATTISELMDALLKHKQIGCCFADLYFTSFVLYLLDLLVLD